MNQGTQGYSLTKKTKGRKSRNTVPLNQHCTVGRRQIVKHVMPGIFKKFTPTSVFSVPLTCYFYWFFALNYYVFRKILSFALMIFQMPAP
jgi:hypothetical protein